MFTSAAPGSDGREEILESADHVVDDVEKPFNLEEVKNALSSMNAWKAPGPDEFHVGSYQENWELDGRQ